MVFQKVKRKQIVIVLIVVFSIVAMIAGIVLWYNADRLNKALSSDNFNHLQLTVSISDEKYYTIRREGDTESVAGMVEQYTYLRDGEKYVLKRSDYADIDGVDGDWFEYSAEEYIGEVLFDFLVFDNYRRSDFKKEDDYYVLRKNADLFFSKFANLSGDDIYTDYDLKFYFDKGKLTKLTADYSYGDDLTMNWIFDFVYGSQDIRIPKATN